MIIIIIELYKDLNLFNTKRLYKKNNKNYEQTRDLHRIKNIMGAI